MASDSSTTTTNSTTQFVTALVTNGAIFLVFIALFLILRGRNRNVYMPRNVISTIPDSQKPRPLAGGIFGWFKDLVSRSDAEILRDAGLDGYFFLRYLRVLVLVCLAGVVILYPILLAVNATGGGSPKGTVINGFNVLSFSNVKNPNRYYAHVFLSWFFYGFVLFTIYRELQYYVSLRQSVLTSPAFASLISRRTVLISTIPDEYLSKEALSQIFEGVKYVTVNRDYSDLAKVIKKRDKLANKIEGAGTKYLKTAVKNRLKSEKKGKTPINGDNIDNYVPQKKRPTYRLKPIIGKKVDTLTYGSEQIAKYNEEIREAQAKAESAKALNSAFVTFESQYLAEICFQVLNHHRPLHMEPKAIGIRPDEIIWPNMKLQWWERIIKENIALALIVLLVIFWSIPVAFVGFISNLDNLIAKLHFLKFLNHLPKVLHGLVTSLLPTIMLAVLMMLLPIFIRKMAKLAGRTSNTTVEYYTQQAYFAFQVVQVFLVTTLTSGAASAITDIINNPSSAMNLLSSKLPAASNFYISYFLLQGLSVSGGMFLRIVALILFYVLGSLLDSTPRKKWSRYNIVGGTGWGTVFPVYTNLGVIAMSYAIISPIILIFAALTFGLIYLAFLNNLSFVIKPTESGGIFFCRALYQTFVGLYIGQVCLLGLYVLAHSWGPIVLQVIFIVVTAFVQIYLQQAFSPLQERLPISLMNENDPSRIAEEPFSDSKAIPSNSYDNIGGPGDVDIEKKKSPLPTGGSFIRYFAPHKFLSPQVLKEELLNSDTYLEPPVPLTPEQEEDAYKSPAVTATNPVVWLPRDAYGLSEKEVAKLRANDVNATDEGSWFVIDEKKKKVKQFGWGDIDEIPVWDKPVQY